MNIRIAEAKDLIKIEEIYNQAIIAGFQTGDTQPIGMDKRSAWFKEHESSDYPIFVCEYELEIIGFTSISPYRKGRMALQKTVEISIYLDKDHQRKGIGHRMIQHAEQKAIQLGYKTIIAIVLEINEASTKMFSKLNYEKWGYLPNVAEFNGINVSHIYFGKQIQCHV